MTEDLSLLGFASRLAHQNICYDFFDVEYASFGDFFGRGYRAVRGGDVIANAFFLDPESILFAMFKKDSEDAELAELPFSIRFPEYDQGDLSDLERSVEGYPSGLLTVLRSAKERCIEMYFSRDSSGLTASYTLSPESLVAVTFWYKLPDHADFIEAYITEERRLADARDIILRVEQSFPLERSG